MRVRLALAEVRRIDDGIANAFAVAAETMPDRGSLKIARTLAAQVEKYSVRRGLTDR